jgi:rhodanese-related sulfurtransferase
MKNIITAVLLSTVLLAFNAVAANAPSQESMRTKSGLYVNSVEAHQMIKSPEGREVVLIDVRDGIEIKFTGYTEMTDIHVPWKIIDSNKWDAKKKSYGGHRNADFSDDLQVQLDEMGISKEAHLIFMCRSGSTRSAPAADIFFEKGYTNVYSMVDGFEGGKAKGGDNKGARVVSGWKNSGLPWGWKLEKDVMYGVN